MQEQHLPGFEPATAAWSLSAYYDIGQGWRLAVNWRLEGRDGFEPTERYWGLATPELIDVVEAVLLKVLRLE